MIAASVTGATVRAFEEFTSWSIERLLALANSGNRAVSAFSTASGTRGNTAVVS